MTGKEPFRIFDFGSFEFVSCFEFWISDFVFDNESCIIHRGLVFTVSQLTRGGFKCIKEHY